MTFDDHHTEHFFQIQIPILNWFKNKFNQQHICFRQKSLMKMNEQTHRQLIIV